ncbi:glutamate ABC transporter substrate-binding protein [Pseudonocardia benzenivorans]|jgi:glutamate transport system substrate-binding protein|uniref:ABC-type transporter, periplasmic subunit family 3 n=2 Tax=Pseudonocardia TaxID=1847 RepID=F4CPU4_PSEUX|nr:glutamate ABC transporter substrate-binding protein [Pseudonocardia dioxanivorans]AEA26127.1 ABC-type transporter, periplasmic subunit family 3 [Pseudonocardia dioxanivorans CB1190]GJF02910.1 ABC transporter substrate-binding protein [Pseudonocardia sp. D17]
MKLRTLVVGLVAGALALSACGKEGSPGSEGSGVSQQVAAGVQVTGSPTFDAIQQRGRVVIGVKDDQPGLGFKDATTGQFSGFDIEIARLVAAQLGYGADKIDYKTVPSAAREDTISRGEVDYYVGTYTINDNRKQRVSFAGPYFIAGQGLLVRSDETAITGKDTLKGKKVCSVTGSTPIQRVRDQGLTEPGNIVEFQTYTQCVDQLLAKQVDVVTTDDAILKGYASQQPDKLKVVGETFSTEPYGIGLNKDDAALRAKINDILQKAYDDGTWQKIYDSTLGKSGSAGSPPPLQRY